MKYRVRVDELKEFAIFLAEATAEVQKLVEQILFLTITCGIPQSRLIFENLLSKLHTFKNRSLFWGLLDLAMLVSQAAIMFRAIHSERLTINIDTIGLLRDITNLCQRVIDEFHQASQKKQKSQIMEVQLTCSQEIEWLINFLQQRLQENTSRALIPVMPSISRLPVVIRIPIGFCHSPYNEKKDENDGGSRSEIITAVSEVVISTSITVTDEKVDDLYQLITELSAGKDLFIKLSRKLMQKCNLSQLSQEAKAGGEFIQRIAVAMDDVVMSMRRVKLEIVFLKIFNIIDSLAVQMGKDISLTMEGDHLTVDKNTVRQLYDPLLKIISNMVKFSIETPVRREVMGKVSQGHIGVKAYFIGTQIVIEIEDDGQSMKGGDVDSKVFDNSDRMAQMNEVCQQIGMLLGKFEMTNLQGRGTKIRITIAPPLIRCTGLLVETAGELFSVPLDNVVEIVRVDYQQLVNKRGRQLLYYRGRVLGILSLAEILGMNRDEAINSMIVVVVTSGQEEMGLLVYKVHNKQEILLKYLPDYLKNSEYIKGVTLTDDGKIALVLDIPVLIDRTKLSNCYVR